MAKGSKGTRSKSSNNSVMKSELNAYGYVSESQAVASATTKASSQNIDYEQYAKRMSNKVGIDPDDLIYADLSEFSTDSISRAVENTSDFDVVGRDRFYLNLINRHGDPKEYTDAVFRYESYGKSLAEIMYELSTTSERTLRNKYNQRSFS